MRVDYFLGGLAVFVVATLTAEWASRKIWPRSPGT